MKVFVLKVTFLPQVEEIQPIEFRNSSIMWSLDTWKKLDIIFQWDNGHDFQ